MFRILLNSTKFRIPRFTDGECVGNVGKSWSAKYIQLAQNAFLLEIGKKVNMACIFAHKSTKIVLIDLFRTSAVIWHLWMGRIVWGRCFQSVRN